MNDTGNPIPPSSCQLSCQVTGESPVANPFHPKPIMLKPRIVLQTAPKPVSVLPKIAHLEDLVRIGYIKHLDVSYYNGLVNIVCQFDCEDGAGGHPIVYGTGNSFELAISNLKDNILNYGFEI